jgi:hypothetical protein
MTATISVRARMHMSAPPPLVAQQYRDIDHHIQHNVHPSIRYSWEPAEPGERKIRTKFSILGVPQYDVSLLEDAPDGSFVIRYLEGSNAGAVLVHRFFPQADGTTLVELEAEIPATFFRRLMGPLFVLGARQVMRRALIEDKRDVEGGGYSSRAAQATH